jgi:predicted HAD superfamily Cof-like phosphohydrolase
MQFYDARRLDWHTTGEKMKITNFEMVGDFMEAFGQEVLYMPKMPDTNLAALRLDLIDEEVQELRDGLGKKSMLEIADALTDILYVVDGAGHSFGIDLDECFDEVHSSNMTKLGEDGRPMYREDGKVMKGPNYREPDLTEFVY